jgi:hypothetical protein
VFDGKTDNEHMVKNFCGSVAESLTSKSNVVFVRFYAEKVGIDSEFRSVSTAMRPLEGPSESCDATVRFVNLLFTRKKTYVNFKVKIFGAKSSNRK